MKPRTFSFTHYLTLAIGIIAFTGASILLTGCGGSEETQMEETGTTPTEAPPAVTLDPMQKMVDSLQAENATLRARANKLEQDKRNVTAQVAELETKLAEAPTRTATPTPIPTPKAAADPKMEYDHALTLFNQRSYQEALSMWMGLLNTGAPEGLESNCHYWIGECFYAMGQYKDALPHFETVFNFAKTTKKDDAQLKIALCYERMGDKASAKKEFQKLVEMYPASPYVERARERLAKLK